MPTERQLTTRDLAGQTDEGRDDESTAADAPLARDDSPTERGDADRGPLLPGDQVTHFTTRWDEIQAGFVDEPRESVERADALVAELMQRLATSFANERRRLEGQWDSGDDVSTEDLRVALTRYRSFFGRLLSA
jgi:hypothetical protein